jgi:long-chain fatty acid transport protein
MRNVIAKTLSSAKNTCQCIVVLVILANVLAGSAWAGGLYIGEFGTPSMGVAGAGANAVANDASTSFHNPAGMTRLESNELMVTGGLFYADIKFDPAPDTPIGGNDGGSAGSIAPLLGGFYVHSLSDDLKLGVNLISITGAVLDYDDSWAGRYQSDEVTLLSITLNPTIGYKVNDWLSIGGGPMFMYATLEMKLFAPPPNGTGTVEIDGDDLALGFDVGTLVEFTEKTRLGLLYTSEIKPEFSGDVELRGAVVNNDFSSDTEIVLPQTIKASIYHTINDQFAVLGTIGWEEWSAFENITLSTASGSAKLPRNWDDTWKFAGGLHYRPSEPWLFQGGIAYDTSPVDAKDRTADMPIDRQIRYALGAQYKLNEKVSMGGAFEYADYGDAEIDNSQLKGKYQNNDIYFFGFNVNWKL